MLGETIGILVGGQSTRMGRPKALIEIEGGTLIERTVAVARQVSDNVVLLGTPPFQLPESLTSMPVWPDGRADRGPIGGLHALLSQMEGHWGVLLSCDMPNLNAPFLKWLISTAYFQDAQAVVCETEEPESAEGFRVHPCCAAYRADARAVVENEIAAERYAMRSLLGGLQVHPLALLGAHACWVENWNEPADIGDMSSPEPRL